jgi:hypothetical protein
MPNGVKKNGKAIKPKSAASYRGKRNVCAATMQARRLRSSRSSIWRSLALLNAIRRRPIDNKITIHMGGDNSFDLYYFILGR